MAPETLDPTRFGLIDFVRTPASDIYAFACICLEVIVLFLMISALE
jgi:hypothetical protein